MRRFMAFRRRKSVKLIFMIYKYDDGFTQVRVGRHIDALSSF
jgi:hypothetical protein